MPSFFENAFDYGTLLWLLGRCGFSLRKSAVIGCALVAAASVTHIYIPGRSAEITDVVIVCAMVVVLKLTGTRHEERPPSPAIPTTG